MLLVAAFSGVLGDWLHRLGTVSVGIFVAGRDVLLGGRQGVGSAGIRGRREHSARSA